MADNFGGGFEQNGFPARNVPETVRSGQCNDCTAQFSAFAASQQFGQRYGWGSSLWSHSTQVYQQAAAQDGVIGDMNEGSRWDNSVPTVYSPNQAAAAQDLSYGVQQYQPCQDPSGELPPLGADDPQGYAELRSRVTTKVAYGEREWTRRGIHRIVDTGTVDVVGVDPGRCEGITGWLAAAAHVRTARSPAGSERVRLVERDRDRSESRAVLRLTALPSGRDQTPAQPDAARLARSRRSPPQTDASFRQPVLASASISTKPSSSGTASPTDPLPGVG
jgi:hypothetical protein